VAHPICTSESTTWAWPLTPRSGRGKRSNHRYGASWIWNLANQLFPAAQIVDLYHACEHVHDLANLAARLLGTGHKAWLAARLQELGAGGRGTPPRRRGGISARTS
jgi:hypothetical protein